MYDTKKRSTVSLRELESLACALLAVLLALLAARVTSHQALGLQLAAQFRIELHQGARNPQLHRIGLTAHSAAQYAGDNVEGNRRIGRRQRRLRSRTLRRSHEILLERAPIHFEIAAARTQIHSSNRPLPPTSSVILHQFSHLARSS